MTAETVKKDASGRLHSPEQLGDTIKISRPVVWIFLSLVIVFLIGVCVWGVVGRLETTVSSVAVVENGTVTAYVAESELPALKTGQRIDYNGTEIAAVEIIGTEAVSLQDDRLGLEAGERRYPVTARTSLPDGTYQVKIITESIRPISFLTSKV